MKKTSSGFTIVELLIVIVVIAILAAISVVAYTGIQRRATNSSIIAGANQSVKLISAYIAANNAYPVASGYYCLVPAKSGACTSTVTRATSTTLNTNLATLGSLPAALPDSSATYAGITYAGGSMTLDGNPINLVLTYSLMGLGQNCGASNALAGTWGTFTTSTTGYHSNGSDYTLCVVGIPGP